MDFTGKGTPHQLSGAACCSGGQEFPSRQREDQCSVSHRQCDSHRLHQPNGGTTLSSPIRFSSHPLEVVPGKEDFNTCRACTRYRKHPSRLGVQTCIGLKRLGLTQGPLPASRGETRTIFHRPVCITHKCSTPSLLQLASRSSGANSRRTITAMDNTSCILVSPIFPDHSLSREDTGGSGNCRDDCSSLAQPIVVSAPTRETEGLSDTSPSNTRHPYQLGRTEPPNGLGRPSATSRLAHLRRSYQERGFSEGVIEMLRKSWRPATEAAYSNAWKQWDCWCLGRGTDPFSAPLTEVLEFLLSQFQAGKQYRTINSLRSAISMTHVEVDGVRIGQHPLVSRFVKAVFNSRPPALRYSFTWDVDIVLCFLQEGPDNDKLSFQALTHKLAMLMALANADRCSDLAALDLNLRSFQTEGVLFIIPGLTKTRRTGPPIQAFYPSFSDSPKLCPVLALREYEQRSKDFRQSQPDNRLFISVRKPHLAVKPCTIGKWLKTIMSDAGIDTNIFTAHSSRGAATSKAKNIGVATADILKAANWSSESTFSRFYHRDIPAPTTFGRVVLKARTVSTDAW